MPRKENNNEKGDLHIKFDVQFPKVLKSEYKQQIIDLLVWLTQMFTLADMYISSSIMT